MWKKLVLSLALIVGGAPFVQGIVAPASIEAAAAAKSKSKSVGRKKTQSVRGYTTKKGTKVAPYKRAPAKRK